MRSIVKWPFCTTQPESPCSRRPSSIRFLNDGKARQEDNRAYEEWSAEQLEARFRLKREDEAKMHAVLERVRARHAENMSKLAAYKMQRQTAINLMKEEAARIRARIVDQGGAPAGQPAAPVQVDPTRPAANDAPLSTTPQAA